MSRPNTPRLCFIGFGEAGQALASGLRGVGVETMSAWDILFPKPDGARLREAGEKIGVRLCTSAADAVRGSDIVVSAVTAALLAPLDGADVETTIRTLQEVTARAAVPRAR